jgi:hypothetical protein
MMDINNIMKTKIAYIMKKIAYILLFIIGVLIVEISLIDLIGYIMLSIVVTYFKCFLDVIIFVVGFTISFKVLSNLDKIKS